LSAILGGGSLELVDVDANGCRHGTSLPLGTLRLAALRAGGERAFGTDDRQDAQARGLARGGRVPRSIVGGSLARVCPACDDRVRLADRRSARLSKSTPRPRRRSAKALAKRKAETLRPIPGLPSSRLAALPDTAALLFVLIRALQPGRLAFSSWGLREGPAVEQHGAGRTHAGSAGRGRRGFCRPTTALSAAQGQPRW
jgi:exopolyphosphatase/guanosine-5'-triphosphate,3'-diphosphate pyrophosphatase